jgi:hypothetical protein
VEVVAAHRERKRHPADRDLGDALRVSRNFAKIELVLEDSEIAPETLIETRAFLIQLAKKRGIDETPAALSQEAGNLATAILDKADSFKLWASGSQMPVALTFDEGEEAWKKVQALTNPYRQWLDLLRASSSENGFELWADPNQHELVVRDRFFRGPRKPRIVWLPCSRDEISWFKVFELEAEEVWERSLLEALREYGVDISREQESELASLLPAHAKEWFDKPRSTWKELTPANAKGALVDDLRMLEVLAGEVGEFEKLKQEDRFAIFARRAREDFGLPDPTNADEKNWRVAATAMLLCTEAAARNPQQQPSEQNRIVPPGLPRDNALRLLRNWQENVNFIGSFEQLGMQADTTVSLTFWARNLTSPPKSYASRATEDTLFKLYAEELDRIEDVEELSRKLATQLHIFQERETKFWGKQAFARVGWKYLVQLGKSAGVLVDAERAETNWKKVQDAVDWYYARGWEIDAGAEELFTEAPDWPSHLHRVRVRMRRAYTRATDYMAAAFSELLAHDPKGLNKLPARREFPNHPSGQG